MEYLVSDIVREVKVLLDENVSSEPLAWLQDTDTLTLEEIIEQKVPTAARLVLERCAHHLLDEGQALTASVMWSRDVTGAGVITLPSDFLRLVSFKMSDWSVPVTDAITETDPRYLMQSSKFAGVRGNKERPIVAIVHGVSGMQLEFYSCGDRDQHVTMARYIDIPRVSNDRISVCVKVHDAIIYRTASMSAEAVGNGELSARLLSVSNELAGISIPS